MIRGAGEADIPDILKLGKVFFDEARWDEVSSWDEASITSTLRAILNRQVEGGLFVAVYDDKVIGIACFMCFPLYFNFAHKCAQELFWYVTPEHQVGAGRVMRGIIEGAAKDMGARLFVMSAMAHMRAKALERLYRMQGYTLRENVFMKRL